MTAEHDKPWTGLANERAKAVVGSQRLLLSFGAVVLATLTFSQAETSLLERELQPFQAATSAEDWYALQEEWRILSGALTAYGEAYIVEDLEPWFKLALASTFGTQGLVNALGPNPTSEQTLATIAAFSQSFAEYNRAVRRLHARASAGIAASELDQTDLEMLATLRAGLENDSVFAAQSETVLQTLAVLDLKAQVEATRSPPFWLTGEFAETYADGTARLDSGAVFVSFHRRFLVEDLRSSEELDSLAIDHAKLIALLAEHGKRNLNGLWEEVNTLTEEIRRRRAATYVTIPGLGIRIPPRFGTTVTLVVNIVILLAAALSTKRLLAAAARILNPATRALAVDVAGHRLPWLRANNSAIRRALRSLPAVAPMLALLIPMLIEGEFGRSAVFVTAAALVMWSIVAVSMSVASRQAERLCGSSSSNVTAS